MRVTFSGFAPAFDAPIEDHAQYLIEQIYHKLYPSGQGASSASASSTPSIARVIHGAQHICRTAIWIPILVSAYCYFFPGSVDCLTSEEIKLLQIAALLHDSGREDEADDLWDLDSAENCYDYLVHHLHLLPEKALNVCAAISRAFRINSR